MLFTMQHSKNWSKTITGMQPWFNMNPASEIVKVRRKQRKAVKNVLSVCRRDTGVSWSGISRTKGSLSWPVCDLLRAPTVWSRHKYLTLFTVFSLPASQYHPGELTHHPYPPPSPPMTHLLGLHQSAESCGRACCMSPLTHALSPHPFCSLMGP